MYVLRAQLEPRVLHTEVHLGIYQDTQKPFWNYSLKHNSFDTILLKIIPKANIMKIGKTTAQLAHIQLREHASLNKSGTYAYATMTPRGE